MKKTVLISVASTLAVVLVIGLIIWFVIGANNKPKDWREELDGNVSCKGEIVAITPREGGHILSIITDASSEQKEIWVYEDTQLSGSFAGFGLQELIDEQVAGVFVSVEAYSATDKIVDGHTLFPAKSITIIEE